MTEVSLCPDLLAHTIELLVDEEEVRDWACGRGSFKHSCGIHDTGRESRATFWKRVAENGGQEGL
jgi:hypothetical protein